MCVGAEGMELAAQCTILGYIFPLLNPLSDDKILDWSKLKQSAFDNKK